MFGRKMTPPRLPHGRAAPAALVSRDAVEKAIRSVPGVSSDAKFFVVIEQRIGERDDLNCYNFGSQGRATAMGLVNAARVLLESSLSKLVSG